MKPFSFDVSIYGELKPFNQTISKARCRIFYKGTNRNGTYITDEFADKLVSTLPYTPVKGIFEINDYSDHGEKRQEGRIYGIVPDNPNFAWEEHEDEDGEVRTYACTDVLLFTALYEEATLIPGKSQSMELYAKSIKGDYQIKNGRRVFVFEDACFLGLQVLGDNVEPCFEGAAFYNLNTLYTSLKTFVDKLEEYNLNFEGGKIVPKSIFKISDDQKYNMIWDLLNPDCNEAGGWKLDYVIVSVYDEYAVVSNINDSTYERVYYTKDEATDSLALGERKRCYIVDVTEEEMNTLRVVQELNGGTYENLDKVFARNSELEQKFEEATGSYSTLETEHSELVGKYEALATDYSNAETTIGELNTKIEELTQYKADILHQEKESIIASYTDKLAPEVLEQITSKMDSYSALELKKELAFALVESSPAVFTHSEPIMVPKDPQTDGLVEYLSKYRK